MKRALATDSETEIILDRLRETRSGVYTGLFSYWDEPFLVAGSIMPRMRKVRLDDPPEKLQPDAMHKEMRLTFLALLGLDLRQLLAKYYIESERYHPPLGNPLSRALVTFLNHRSGE